MKDMHKPYHAILQGLLIFKYFIVQQKLLMYSTRTVLVKIKYTLSEYNGMQVMSCIHVTLYVTVALCHCCFMRTLHRTPHGWEGIDLSGLASFSLQYRCSCCYLSLPHSPGLYQALYPALLH